MASESSVQRFAGVQARLREILAHEPRPVAGVFVFCAFMSFVYMPYDVFGKLLTQNIADAQEVWLGYMLRGSAAKLSEPLHWAIYGALTLGFYRARPWAWPCAALYTLQVAVSMLGWSVRYGRYGALGNALMGVVALLFALLAGALWRARPATGAAR